MVPCFCGKPNNLNEERLRCRVCNSWIHHKCFKGELIYQADVETDSQSKTIESENIDGRLIPNMDVGELRELNIPSHGINNMFDFIAPMCNGGIDPTSCSNCEGNGETLC